MAEHGGNKRSDIQHAASRRTNPWAHRIRRSRWRSSTSTATQVLEAGCLADAAERLGIRLIGVDRPGMGLSTLKPARRSWPGPTTSRRWRTISRSIVSRWLVSRAEDHLRLQDSGSPNGMRYRRGARPGRRLAIPWRTRAGWKKSEYRGRASWTPDTRAEISGAVRRSNWNALV